MDLDKSKELCRILKTGKQDSQNYKLPDELTKLSEAELLDFLKKNEKEIIDGVIDTFSECGIKITVNDHVVIIESPGHYKITYDVETGKQIKAEAEAEAEAEAQTKPNPNPNPGFGSSAPRFPTTKSRDSRFPTTKSRDSRFPTTKSRDSRFPTTKSRVPGGTKFTGRNITKKNRANLTHLKKNIRGMVINGGKGRNFIEYICIALVVVPLRLPSITIMCIKYVCRKIYNHFNDNSSKVVPTNYDNNARVEPINYDDNANANSLSIYDIGLGITNNNQGIAFVIYKAVEEDNLNDLNNAISQVKDKSILKSILNTEFYKQGQYSATSATSLMVACERNNLEIVETLLSHGADVNKQTTRVDRFDRYRETGITALYIASENNRDLIVKYLLEHGADPDLATTGGETPLYRASNNGYDRVVAALLVHRADPNLATTKGKTPLHEACTGYFYTQEQYRLRYKIIIDLLLGKGADINKADEYGQTPIFKITHSKPLKVLIDAGADVNMADKNGETPLFFVTRYGTYLREKQESYLLVLNTLIEAKADINKANNKGETPLYVATQRVIDDCQEYQETQREIKGYQKNTDASEYRAYKNLNPIIVEDIKIVKDLLNAGANVYEETSDSNIKSPIDAVKKAHDLDKDFSEYLSGLFDPYSLKYVTKYIFEPPSNNDENEGNTPSNILAKSVLGVQDLNKVIEGYLGPPRLLNKDSKEQRREILLKRRKTLSRVGNDDGTPGGKNSRSKTRKQKRRKTKK